MVILNLRVFSAGTKPCRESTKAGRDWGPMPISPPPKGKPENNGITAPLSRAAKQNPKQNAIRFMPRFESD
jgi:hypothetical protein